jgi:hypothetical protein
VSTKLYGLVALAVGAVLLGPARAQAQSQSEEEWIACMEVWASEAICGAQPPPPPPPADEPPPPPPADEPPPPPPADEPPPPAAAAAPPPPAADAPPPPPADEPPPPPPVDEPPPPPPPVDEAPPPPPEPEQCANGKHSGHSVAASGNATGHVCGSDSAREAGSHRHDHGRHLGHAAKAKAALHRFANWCQSFVPPRGRH